MGHKKRYLGLDILRVVCMCGIVGLHLLYRGGVLEAVQKGSATWFGMWILESSFYCAVNAFAILSGFLCSEKKDIDYFRLLSLLTTVLFWCVVIIAVFFCFCPEVLKTANILIFLFPSLNGRYWYITCYILMFVMIPYMNIVVRNLRKKHYQHFLLILFVLLSIVPTIGKADFFRTGNGYSPWWLIYNYFIGAYFNKYGFGKMKKRLLMGAYLANVMLAVLSVYFEWEMGLQYISPFIVGNAVCLFGIFYNVSAKEGWISEGIRLAADMAFDVYIIHSHILIFDFVIKGRLEFVSRHHVIRAVSEVIFVILAIYIICQVLGIIRSKIFKVIGIDNLLRKIGNIINSFTNFEEGSVND